MPVNAHISVLPIFSFIILMNQHLQEEILQQNTKLLRKSLLMPQTTTFEYLKGMLDRVITNGINLFNKWCNPQQSNAQQQQNEQQSLPQQGPRGRLQYNFQIFEENPQNDTNEDVENRNQSFNRSSKQLESFSDDREYSKIVEEEQSFENRYKKGNKRMKRDISESSLQKENKKYIKNVDKQASHFYESINFAVFLEMQKNIIEARKKCTDRNEIDNSLRNEEYIKYVIKVGSLSTTTDTKIDTSQLALRSETTTVRKQQKNLRKKVQFEDDSHQLYDLSKVFETLDAEKMRREQNRKLQAQKKRREEEERLRMIERIELQKKMEAQRQLELEAARLQRQLQENQKRQAAERLQEEQRQRQNENQNSEVLQSANNKSETLQAAERQPSSVEDNSKSPVLDKQDPPQLPQSSGSPILKKKSQQKKQQVLVGTPVKSDKAEQKSLTLFKMEKSNNPFFNQPTKALNFQDLINTHKSPVENSFFSASLASPPRSNIFNNNQVPVNNIFTGGQSHQQQQQSMLATSSAPMPSIMQQPTLPSFSNPLTNNQSSFNQTPPPGSFFPILSNNSGFINSSNSIPNSNSSSIQPTFPMPIPSSFSKNLFMNQPAQQTSLFGSSNNAASSTSQAARSNSTRKKGQIRVS